jgi:hypothetical protein
MFTLETAIVFAVRLFLALALLCVLEWAWEHVRDSPWLTVIVSILVALLLASAYR